MGVTDTFNVHKAQQNENYCMFLYFWAVLFLFECSYFRFVNGMITSVNVTTPEADFGPIESFNYSNYTLLKNGV